MASTDGLQHERSFWRGVLFATLASPLALTLVALMTTPHIASADRVLAGMAVIAVVTMPASLLAITLLGLPVFVLLRRRRWLNWATVCVAAVLTAMLANVAVVAVAGPVQTDKAFFQQLDDDEKNGRWADAAQSIRSVRVAKPAWLAQRNAEVLQRQMRVAVETGDMLELLGAAKQYLDGSNDRAQQAVAIARLLGERGARSDAALVHSDSVWTDPPSNEKARSSDRAFACRSCANLNILPLIFLEEQSTLCSF